MRVALRSVEEDGEVGDEGDWDDWVVDMVVW